MPILITIIVVAVLILLIVLFVNLIWLFLPVILILWVFSYFTRQRRLNQAKATYKKAQDNFSQNYKHQNEEYHASNDDVIDVNYTVIDEQENDK